MQTQTPQRRLVNFGLTISSLRRSLIYKPLAILMAILLAPAVSWINSGGTGRGAAPFQAKAQAAPLCNTTVNCIFSPATYFSQYEADLVQLESDAVNAYLGFHGLPASDAHVIYDFGREDLRSGVRAAIYTILLGIIVESPSSRSAHEQNLYNWLQKIVQANEIQEYTLALQQFNHFRNDPCTFGLDPNIASSYKLTFDGSPWCFGGLLSSIFSPPVPAASYFQSYGLIHSYSAKVDTDPNYASIFADSSISAGEIAGIAIAAGTVVAGIVGGIIASSVAAAAAAFAADGFVASLAVNTGFLISGAAAAGLGGVFLVAAPVTIIFICVIAAVVAAMELFNNEKELNDISKFNGDLTSAMNTPPDLLGMANDSTGLGSFKLQNSVYSQTDPDVASTAALPTHQPTDLQFAITPQSTGVQQVTPTLQYQDWNGDQWTAQTWGGWFVQTCAQGTSGTPCPRANSITGDLRYVDWQGTNWIAARLGNEFVSTKATKNPGDQVCQTDTVTGVTIAGGTNPFDLSQCISYVSRSISMLDQNGHKISVSITTFATPIFNDPGPLTFSAGTPATVNIVAAGNPAPSIDWIAGLGGNHFNFPLFTGSSFALSFDGSLQAQTGTFTLTLKASNSLGSVTQNFTVKVVDVLSIYAPATLTGTAGTPMNFRVVGGGIPTPKLSYNGFDLPGLTFKDNGDGTGSLSGIYTGTTFVEQCIPVLGSTCGGFVATNSQGSVTQVVAINFTTSNDAFPTPASVTFTAGVNNVANLSSFGASTPVTWLTLGGFPPWLHFQDLGNGNAILSGMPPAGTTGTFEPFISPHALGSGGNFVSQYPVVVVDTPAFTSPNLATFTVGSQGDFEITVTGGSITTSSTLPQGLAFGGGNNQAKITGNPAPGTGGQYHIKLNVSSPDGSTTQDLTLNVNEATHITSPNQMVLFAGKPASFAVTTTGFPNVSTHKVAANSGPPASPSQGDGTFFTVSGLSNSFQASNQNTLGLATGTLTISGTPQVSDVGTHKVQITAQNAVGTPAVQTLTLLVFPNNPAAGVNLVTSSVLSRNANNDVVATVVVANNGGAAAQDVAITSAKIGGVAGVISPNAVASIAPQSSATFTVIFPANSLGGAGTLTVLNLSGTYTGGTFSNAGRIVLP